VPEWITFLSAHILFGLSSGAALRYLYSAQKKGSYTALAWAVLVAFLGGVFWFSSYVGTHVRERTFEGAAGTSSVILMFVAFGVGFLLMMRAQSRHSQGVADPRNK
jgi:FtsH-binding integral membrane protein